MTTTRVPSYVDGRASRTASAEFGSVSGATGGGGILQELMRVNAAKADPLFGKKDQASFTESEFAAMADTGVMIEATGNRTAERFGGQGEYDDGFVAYLNGTEVARRNAPAGAVPGNSAASSDRPTFVRPTSIATSRAMSGGCTTHSRAQRCPSSSGWSPS